MACCGRNVCYQDLDVGMNDELLWVLGLLLAAVVLFITGKVRMDVVALLVIVAFVLSGTLTLAEATAGFSDPNVLLIAALFVIGDGLVRTGIALSVGDWLVRMAGNSELRMLLLLMISVSALGAFMSSTGVVAIFIPVVLSAAHENPAGTADDAAQFRRAYQRHDDAGGDAAQYGGQ